MITIGLDMICHSWNSESDFLVDCSTLTQHQNAAKFWMLTVQNLVWISSLMDASALEHVGRRQATRFELAWTTMKTHGNT
jgi:hypothetical protein